MKSGVFYAVHAKGVKEDPQYSWKAIVSSITPEMGPELS
jgi:hypothetical protein